MTKKWWKKRGKQLFQKHTNCASKKWEKNAAKIAKKRFLYSHEYSDQKWGKNARNNISRNKPIVRAINVGNKLSQKSAKNVFSIHTTIVPKNGGKTRETISPETHQ